MNNQNSIQECLHAIDAPRIEAAAKAIYALFDGADPHPWVEGGNSDKQYVARKYARAAVAALNSYTAGQIAPFGYFYQLLDAGFKPNGVFLGTYEKKVTEQSRVDGETDDHVFALYVSPSEEILALHRQLAAERLRADQGWARAEMKSQECTSLREQIAARGEPVYQAEYHVKHPHAWVDVTKYQYDLYNEQGEGKISTRVLYTIRT